jgi:chemotaxis protein histidine kinase CheA
MKLDENSHFDYNDLLERYENNIVMINKVIPIASKGFKEIIILLNENVQAKDMDALKQIAHRLKGTAKSLSLPILTELSEKLESMDFETEIADGLFIKKLISEIEIINAIFDSR